MLLLFYGNSALNPLTGAIVCVNKSISNDHHNNKTAASGLREFRLKSNMTAQTTSLKNKPAAVERNRDVVSQAQTL